MRLVIVAALAVLLAACQTVKPTALAVPSPEATKVDQKIAAVSKTLAKQCALLAIAISAGQAFSSNPKVDEALVAAEGARQAFCAHPPTDTASAIQTVADMAIAVNAALAQAQ